MILIIKAVGMSLNNLLSSVVQVSVPANHLFSYLPYCMWIKLIWFVACVIKITQLLKSKDLDTLSAHI